MLDYEYILSDLQILVKLNPTSRDFKVYYINKHFLLSQDQSIGYLDQACIKERLVTGNHFLGNIPMQGQYKIYCPAIPFDPPT